MYGRLFKYRESPKRTPLEDFLTEALADFINRLPSSIRSSFIGELFIPQTASQEWASLNAADAVITANTQYQIEDGRIDLLILVNGTPTIVIENKVSAPFTSNHGAEDQLIRYGRWLQGQCPLKWPSTLCLLTHITPSPRDFLSEGARHLYQVHSKVCSWSRLGRKLDEIARSEWNDVWEIERTRFLAQELFTFLRERGMTGEYAGLDEFAAAFLYLKAADKMEHTFETISVHLDSMNGVFPKLSYSYDASLWYETSNGLIWGWRCLTGSLQNVYFGYGISKSPKQHFTGGTIPDGDSIFICVATDHKREFDILRTAATQKQKPDWTVSSIGDSIAWISFRSLSEALSNPEGFAPLMIAWIDDNKDELDRFVRDLKK